MPYIDWGLAVNLFMLGLYVGMKVGVRLPRRTANPWLLLSVNLTMLSVAVGTLLRMARIDSHFVNAMGSLLGLSLAVAAVVVLIWKYRTSASAA